VLLPVKASADFFGQWLSNPTLQSRVQAVLVDDTGEGSGFACLGCSYTLEAPAWPEPMPCQPYKVQMPLLLACLLKSCNLGIVWPRQCTLQASLMCFEVFFVLTEGAESCCLHPVFKGCFLTGRARVNGSRTEQNTLSLTALLHLSLLTADACSGCVCCRTSQCLQHAGTLPWGRICTLLATGLRLEYGSWQPSVGACTVLVSRPSVLADSRNVSGCTAACKVQQQRGEDAIMARARASLVQQHHMRFAHPLCAQHCCEGLYTTP